MVSLVPMRHSNPYQNRRVMMHSFWIMLSTANCLSPKHYLFKTIAIAICTSMLQHYWNSLMPMASISYLSCSTGNDCLGSIQPPTQPSNNIQASGKSNINGNTSATRSARAMATLPTHCTLDHGGLQLTNCTSGVPPTGTSAPHHVSTTGDKMHIGNVVQTMLTNPNTYPFEQQHGPPPTLPIQ